MSSLTHRAGLSAVENGTLGVTYFPPTIATTPVMMTFRASACVCCSACSVCFAGCVCLLVGRILKRCRVPRNMYCDLETHGDLWYFFIFLFTTSSHAPPGCCVVALLSVVRCFSWRGSPFCGTAWCTTGLDRCRRRNRRRCPRMMTRPSNTSEQHFCKIFLPFFLISLNSDVACQQRHLWRHS